MHARVKLQAMPDKCADTRLFQATRRGGQTNEKRATPTSYAAALLSNITIPSSGAVGMSGGCGGDENSVGVRPVGLQVNAATVDEIAVAEDDECTEGEILNEMTLEILRRRLNGQIGRLRKKENLSRKKK